MKVTIEIDLPEGQAIPSAEDILTLTSPDWYTERWHYTDVIEENPWLTPDQARQVLELMYRHHDCNVGTNWEYINTLVNEYFDEPEENDE
jgi:hypothetical protein